MDEFQMIDGEVTRYPWRDGQEHRDQLDFSRHFENVEVWSKYHSEYWDRRDCTGERIHDRYNVECGVFFCKDCILITTHGFSDGTLKYIERVEQVIQDYDGLCPIFIHCCHPFEVFCAQPAHIATRLISMHSTNVGYHFADLKAKTIQTFMRKY